MLPGPYRVPAYRGRVRVVLTNKTPCGTYRAPGRFEGTAAREQLLDVAADRLGIDPIELRRRNLLGPGELPHRAPDDHPRHRRGAGRRGLPRAARGRGGRADRLGYRAQAGPRADTPAAAAGSGVAMFVEKSGLGPQETADVTVSSPARCACCPAARRWARASRRCSPRSPRTRSASDPQAVDVVNGRGHRPASRSAPGPGRPGRRWWPGARCTSAASAVRARAHRARRPDAGGGRGRPAITDGTVSVRGDPAVRSAWARSPQPPPRPAPICCPASPPGCPRAAVSRCRT